MKKSILLFVLSLLISSPFCLSGNAWKSYLDIIREELGKEPPQTGLNDNVRDTKMHGDQYLHFFQNTIDGRGKITKKRKWCPDTRKTINFSHSMRATLIERVTSTQEELQKGILKSEFTVQKFSEHFGIGKAGVTFGIISSNEVLKGLVEIGKAITKNEKQIISASSTAVAAALKFFLHVPWERGVPISLKAATVVTKLIKWYLGDKLSKEIDEDGNYLLTSEDVRDKFPEFENVLIKLRNLEGSKVKTVWKQGIGYTKIDISTLNTKEVTEEDRKLIAKMIYRTNPVGAQHFYPKDKENAKKWNIEAQEFASVFSLCGIEFNRLEGNVWVRNRGTKYRKDYHDECALGRNEVPVVTLDIDPNHSNSLLFVPKIKTRDDLTVKLTPIGKILIATKKNNEKNIPTYIREISCSGNFENVLKKHIKGDSMLLYVDMEESSLKVQGQYLQQRFREK